MAFDMRGPGSKVDKLQPVHVPRGHVIFFRRRSPG